MARQRNTQIIGTFGNIIHYKWRDDYYSRTKGNTGRQGKPAKKQASILGNASAVSAKLRACFKTMLPQPTNRKLMYRLNNALQQWLRTGQATTTEPVNDIPFLSGFVFYGDQSAGLLRTAMKLNRRPDGDLSLELPAFDSPNPIHPLPFNGHIQLSIIAASCNLKDIADVQLFETSLDIPYNGIPIPAQELLLPLQSIRGCISVVAVSVNKMTAGIVGALYN